MIIVVDFFLCGFFVTKNCTYGCLVLVEVDDKLYGGIDEIVGNAGTYGVGGVIPFGGVITFGYFVVSYVGLELYSYPFELSVGTAVTGPAIDCVASLFIFAISSSESHRFISSSFNFCRRNLYRFDITFASPDLFSISKNRSSCSLLIKKGSFGIAYSRPRAVTIGKNPSNCNFLL